MQYVEGQQFSIYENHSIMNTKHNDENVSNYKKLMNIQRDARVALSMVTGGKTNGLDNYLVIDGRARITEGGAPQLLNRLAQIYVAPGTTFPPSGTPQGYIARITAERIHGIGPWSE